MDGPHTTTKTPIAVFVARVLLGGLAILGLSLLPLGAASKACIVTALILVGAGLLFTRRRLWVSRISFGGSLLSLLLAVLLTESSLQLTAFTLLYLFIWA